MRWLFLVLLVSACAMPPGVPGAKVPASLLEIERSSCLKTCGDNCQRQCQCVVDYIANNIDHANYVDMTMRYHRNAITSTDRAFSMAGTNMCFTKASP